jgi:hypothetical protein
VPLEITGVFKIHRCFQKSQVFSKITGIFKNHRYFLGIVIPGLKIVLSLAVVDLRAVLQRKNTCDF